MKPRWLLVGAGLLTLGCAGLLLVRGNWRKPPPPADPFPLTPISASPFLNTGPAAHYVGSAACLPCHQDEHASFHRTGMGRSMADIDFSVEPPDAAFDHPPSKRRYQIVRKDGQLWHRELLLTDAPQEVVLSEFPVKYVVGSGRHARTYLTEVDGFLVESPVTWYPSRRAWDMSPGYDAPDQLGFARAVGDGCLYCHAGRAEPIGDSLHRMHIDEEAIGCERCHGPGSLHVEAHAERKQQTGPPSGQTDFTIVNPAHLSRELAEAVCQQCHLKTVAMISLRGRKLSDFRPGLPLQDFREDYVAETDRSMKVVGHVEQMHLSRCYQATDSLTCITCHDPHAEPAAGERTAYYNAVCLRCHEPQRCTVDPHRRMRESPDNNCIQCHMPRSSTDIPHLAFTHHRIGIHDKPPVGQTSDAPPSRLPSEAGEAELRTFLAPPRWSDIDRRLSLGLAFRDASLREKDGAWASHYQKQAMDLMSAVRNAGLRNPDLDAALAQLSSDLKTGDPLTYAESALGQPGLAGESRCDALLAAAQTKMARGDWEGAAAALRDLTQLRRHPLDWLLLANCDRALGDEAGAADALTVAVGINPRLWNVHHYLADYYRQDGDAERAAWHDQRAVR